MGRRLLSFLLPLAERPGRELCVFLLSSLLLALQLEFAPFLLGRGLRELPRAEFCGAEGQPSRGACLFGGGGCPQEPFQRRTLYQQRLQPEGGPGAPRVQERSQASRPPGHSTSFCQLWFPRAGSDLLACTKSPRDCSPPGAHKEGRVGCLPLEPCGPRWLHRLHHLSLREGRLVWHKRKI